VAPTTVAGDTYTLEVYVGGRDDTYYDANPVTDLQIGLNSSAALNTYIPATGIAPAAGGWSLYTATYVATASGLPITILLEENSSNQQGDWTDVTLSYVSAVPLPAALPLFAGGLSLFGGIGYWRKRRRNKATALAAA
jgi:hypothetical protein